MNIKIIMLSSFIALSLPSIGKADVYVYKHLDGSVLITERPQNANPNYTLMQIRRTNIRASEFPKVTVHFTRPKIITRDKGIDQLENNSVFDSAIDAIASKHGVDAKLVKAVVRVESDFQPRAVSPKGARGLMQLMPGTAKRYGVVNSFDPVDNLVGGVRYLKDLLDMFDNNLTLALAAYNAGEGAVQKYNVVPPYKETRQYVQKVIHYHRLYSINT